MEKEAIGNISKHFGELQDPRTGNAKAHIFLEILIIAICAVICGADGWGNVGLFGKNKKEWLKNVFKINEGHSLSRYVWACVCKNQARRISKALYRMGTSD